MYQKNLNTKKFSGYFTLIILIFIFSEFVVFSKNKNTYFHFWDKSNPMDINMQKQACSNKVNSSWNGKTNFYGIKNKTPRVFQSRTRVFHMGNLHDIKKVIEITAGHTEIATITG